MAETSPPAAPQRGALAQGSSRPGGGVTVSGAGTPSSSGPEGDQQPVQPSNPLWPPAPRSRQQGGAAAQTQGAECRSGQAAGEAGVGR